jgi:hypothetical protein
MKMDYHWIEWTKRNQFLINARRLGLGKQCNELVMDFNWESQSIDKAKGWTRRVACLRRTVVL